MKLRRFAVIIGLCALAAGCGKEKEPGTIRILALNLPQATFEQWLADNVFTPRTGIKVVFDIDGDGGAEESLERAVAAGSNGYDLVHYESPWLGIMVTERILTRLDTPDYLGESRCPVKFGDFLGSVSYVLGRYPVDERDIFAGKYEKYSDAPVYGLPWATDCQVLFYRADLLEAAGMAGPPQTWRAFANSALKLNEPPRRYGAFTHAGFAGASIVRGFLPILWSFGGSLWNTASGKTAGALNGRASVKALAFYSSWNSRFGIVPAEAAKWGDEDVLNALAQDKVAMGAFWARHGAKLEDPVFSKIAGKLSYAVLPGVKDRRTGRIHRVTMSGCRGVGIVSGSKNTRDAWRYLKWLMSVQTQKALLDDSASAFVSARKDLAGYTASRSLRSKTVLDSLVHMRDLWNHPRYRELTAIVQRELNLAFIGSKSAKRALDSAATEAQKVLDGGSKESID